MKKSLFPALMLALALLCGCAAEEAPEQTEATFADTEVTMVVTVDSIRELALYPDLRKVDLSGSTCYDAILEFMAQRPDVEVTYTVDLGGVQVDNHTAALELEVGSFDFACLAESLRYLPELAALSLPATDLTVDQLWQLGEQVELTWTVLIRDQEVSWDATELTLENADGQEVLDKLPLLPCLENVTFTGTAPENGLILQMKEIAPQTAFHWEFTLFGLTVTSDDTELDLSGIPMDSVEELENSLACFNNLEKVVMCDTGLPSADIDAMWKRHPETRFVWNVKIGRFWVRTDIIYLMPYQHGYTGGSNYYKLDDADCVEMKYLVDIVCLDFGHMNITDISFVQYMPNLEFLIIGATKVTDLSPLAGAQKLKYLEAFYSGVEDISALAECPALEDVNICHNKITDFTPLLGLEKLQHIWIAGHKISDEMKAQLEAAHPDAIIVYQLEGSTGGGWRKIPNYYAQRDLMGMFYLD